MAKSEILKAIEQICEEKGIATQSVIETIEAALAVAYRKDFGEKNQNIKVEFNPETAESRIFDVKEVVEDPPPEEKLEEKDEQKEDGEKGTKNEKPVKKEKQEEIKAKKNSGKDKGKSEEDLPPDLSSVALARGEALNVGEEAEEEKRFNPKTQLGITEAKKIKKTAKIGDKIRTEFFPPDAYGRMAAQTAKQVIIQKLREAERDMVYRDFKDKEGEIINGAVQRVEGRMALIDLGNTTGIMPPPEQVPSENYAPGQRIKVYIVSVNKTTKGPEILVSRSHPEMVKKLFTLEVPEIANGTIEIKAVAREAGSRSKISVESKDPNIDPVGSCVGQRGARVQTVISELGGEKIDIIEYSEDPIRYIINSLSPAKILNVKLDEKEKRAQAEVKEDQLSLTIGRAGQNVRLSAKLTGWRIDVVKEGEKKQKNAASVSPAEKKSVDQGDVDDVDKEKPAKDKKVMIEKPAKKEDNKEEKEEEEEEVKEKKKEALEDNGEKPKKEEKNKSKDNKESKED